MKLSLLALAAVTGLASCQCVSSIPECARSCLMISAGSVGCGETDYACQCTSQHQTDITTDATTCVLAACGEQVALNEVLPAADAFCSAINAGESCSSASAGSTSSVASSSSGSTSSQDSTLPTSVSLTSTGTDATPTTRSSSSASGAATTTDSSGTGTATGTATDASAGASSTAGAATMGSVGSLGIAVLGALVML